MSDRRLISSVGLRGGQVLRVAVSPDERLVVVHRDGAPDALVLNDHELNQVLGALTLARRSLEWKGHARGFARDARREAMRAGKGARR